MHIKYCMIGKSVDLNHQKNLGKGIINICVITDAFFYTHTYKFVHINSSVRWDMLYCKTLIYYILII